jgi:hypothetical protein
MKRNLWILAMYTIFGIGAQMAAYSAGIHSQREGGELFATALLLVGGIMTAHLAAQAALKE